MSHAEQTDRLLIKPAAGARPAPPCTRRQFIPKARTASHPTSHKRHGDTRLATDSDRATRRVSQSPEAVRLDRAGADEFSVACRSLPRTDPYAHGKVSPAMTREAS